MSSAGDPSFNSPTESVGKSVSLTGESALSLARLTGLPTSLAALPSGRLADTESMDRRRTSSSKLIM